jgi:hypothetical protein
MKSTKFKWWHVGLIIFSALISLCYATQKPTYCDEMYYIDPGAHLALQGRMFSTTWYTNSPNELWASSNPGMPLLFAGWFKIFGFGLIQSRILFLILYLSGIYLFFTWIKNKFCPSALALTLGICGSFLLPSYNETLFNLRLEILAYHLFTLFLYYTWTDKENIFVNWVAPVLLGLLTVFFGFHFSGFFLLAAGLAYLFKRDKNTFLKGFALVIGIGWGVVILWMVYQKLGMWDTFIASRASHIGKQLPWCPTGLKKLIIFKDWSLFLSLAVVGLLGNLQKNRSQWLPWVLAIVAFFAIPYIISSTGIYYKSYIWMVSIPIILCFYYGENTLKGWFKTFSIILVTVSLIKGSINEIEKLNYFYKVAQTRSHVLAIVKNRFPDGTSIVANSNFYYDLISNGFKIYPFINPTDGIVLGYELDYYFPKNLRDEVKCIIVSSDEMKRYPTIFDIGGEWFQIGKFSGSVKKDPSSEFNIFIKK